jgi:hypothetical protein
MKKTLVAVAAIFAATGAMADATISGFFDSAYTINSVTAAGTGITTKKTTLAPSGSGQNQITFGSSEDLGGGMKAFANLRIMPLPNSNALNQDASEIGVSGGFGTFQIGKDYSIDHGVIAQVDASGYTGGSPGVVNLGNGGASGNAVIYVLPTMVSGVGIIVAKGLANGAAGDGDATAYRLSYSTGGLLVQYAGASVSNVAAGTWQTGFATGGATAATEVTAANSKGGITALGISYNLGMATVSYGSFTAKSGGDSDQKASANIMGVSIPFGATTIGLTSSSAKRTNAFGTAVKASGTRAKLSYALSKRTSAYGAIGSESVEGTTATTKQTAIGLTHSF